jgi:hypothetical protein
VEIGCQGGQGSPRVVAPSEEQRIKQTNKQSKLHAKFHAGAFLHFVSHRKQNKPEVEKPFV